MANEIHVRAALRLMHGRESRAARLEEVLAAHPGLVQSGIDPSNSVSPATAAAEWPHDELRRALLWLAVCNRANKKSLEECGFYRGEAERMTGGDVSRGSLIAAAYMCDLRVFESPPDARLGLIPPLSEFSSGHLLACDQSRCSGACLLTNRWVDVRAWRYPSLTDLVARAGYLWDDVPRNIQVDLTQEYERGHGGTSVADEVSELESLLLRHAPEAHEGWGWCSTCDEHHLYPHDDGEYIEMSPSPASDRARDARLRRAQQ